MKIANIGSSFSAGPTIPPIVNPSAGRSGSNFTHLFAKHLNAELIDLSVSGATLLNLLSEPQVVRGGHTFPPQVEQIPSDVDMVLVLGGGNDMHYITNIITETWLGWFMIKAMSFFQSPLPPEADETTIYQRFSKLLDAVHARAANARVVVVEYLTVFGADAVAGGNMPCAPERIEYHRSVAAQLQRATEKAVNERKPWCDILHTAKLSEMHGVGSKEPWVFGLDFSTLRRGEAWVHPNARGMEAVAELLKEL